MEREFIASMTFEVSPATAEPARRLLVAELVGRRWFDRVRDRRMPQNCLWTKKKIGPDQNTSHIHRACAEELETCAARVRDRGHTLEVRRAFIQVAGGGTYGLAPPPTGDG